MGNAKPWQIILIVLAGLALAFGVWQIVFSNRISQPVGYMTVDVMTGQLYDIQKGKARGVMLPANHPETGNRTLYPVVNEDGVWKIDPAYAAHMPEALRREAKFSSPESFQISPSPPVRHVLMK
jgi:hypothetical protein